MGRGAAAVWALCALLSAAAGLAAQELPAAVSARLSAEGRVLAFSLKPDALSLLPDFSGAAAFRARHAEIYPHFSQEGLFLLPGGYPSVDDGFVAAMLAAVPSLAGLSWTDERTGDRVLLFKAAEILGEPVSSDGRLSFVLKTADVEFGTARFAVSMNREPGRVELRMTNLDSLKFLFFPAVRPGRAVVDLIYFPNGNAPLIYLAWSCRAVFYVAGAVEVERPLRARALALADWYVRRLEAMKR